VGRIGQRPRPAGPELAVEAVDRARGGEDASDERLQLGAAASRGDDLGLGLLGVRVDRVVEEARGGPAGQGALEQVEAGLRVAVGVGLGDVALLDLDVDDVAVGVLDVEAAGQCPLLSRVGCRTSIACWGLMSLTCRRRCGERRADDVRRKRMKFGTQRRGSWPCRPARIGDDQEVDEWSALDEEAFARSVFRRRWLNALHRSGVTTVGEARAMSGDRLLRIPNVGPKAIAEISQALADATVRSDDPLECLGLPTARVSSERDRELIRMRQQGVTLAQLARRFRISRERVRQILERDGW
jgi:hypothetical protein